MTTWCRFRQDNKDSYGMVEGGQVIAVDGTPFGEHQQTARAYPLKRRQTADPGGAADLLLRRHQLRRPHP